MAALCSLFMLFLCCFLVHSMYSEGDVVWYNSRSPGHRVMTTIQGGGGRYSSARQCVYATQHSYATCPLRSFVCTAPRPIFHHLWPHPADVAICHTAGELSILPCSLCRCPGAKGLRWGGNHLRAGWQGLVRAPFLVPLLTGLETDATRLGGPGKGGGGGQGTPTYLAPTDSHHAPIILTVRGVGRCEKTSLGAALGPSLQEPPVIWALLQNALFPNPPPPPPPSPVASANGFFTFLGKAGVAQLTGTKA